MDDHIGRECLRRLPEALIILQQRFDRTEIRMLAKNRAPSTFEIAVVIVRHPVLAVDKKALRKQKPGEMETDETGGPGYQYAPRCARSRLPDMLIASPAS